MNLKIIIKDVSSGIFFLILDSIAKPFGGKVTKDGEFIGDDEAKKATIHEASEMFGGNDGNSKNSSD